MKSNKILNAVAVIMGIIMVIYIAAMAMPHIEYKASKRVPVGSGDETELVVEEKEMNLLSFMAFPDTTKDAGVKALLQKEGVEYDRDNAVNGPVLLFAFAIVGAVFSILLRKKFSCIWLPLAWSIYGLYVYFTNAFVMLGQTDYYVQLALLIIVGVLAIVLGAMRLPGVIAERKQIRMEIRITKERERGMQEKRKAMGKA